MRRYWQYLKYVLRHKWFVFQAGRKLGVPLLMLILHDWDKFMPDEWFPYARTFYKPNGEKQYVENNDFTLAWNRHQKRNKHHWQYWMITWDHGGTDALPMPDVFRREMLADWHGAGRAIKGKDANTLVWYTENRNKMILHDETRRWLDVQLGYREDDYIPPGQLINFIVEHYKMTGNLEQTIEETRKAFASDGFQPKAIELN